MRNQDDIVRVELLPPLSMPEFLIYNNAQYFSCHLLQTTLYIKLG